MPDEWYNDATIVTHNTYLTNTNLLVDAVLLLHFVVLHQLFFTKSGAKVQISEQNTKKKFIFLQFFE